MSERKPIREFRSGQVRAAIWENEYWVEGKTRTFLAASIAKSYTDDQGNWKTSHSFNKRELEHAKRVIQEALDFMTLHEVESWRGRKKK